MVNISPTPQFNAEQPVKQWLDELENYMHAAVGTVNELSTIGPAAKKVIANLAQGKKDTYANLTAALKERYTETHSDVIERHVFNRSYIRIPRYLYNINT